MFPRSPFTNALKLYYLFNQIKVF